MVKAFLKSILSIFLLFFCLATASATAPVFVDGFESGLRFSLDGWSSKQMQNSIQNRVEISTELPHSGKYSLKFVAGPTQSGLVKADIQKYGIAFGKHQNFWFSGWFYLKSQKETENLFLLDIEDSKAHFNSPGRRLMLSGPSNYLIFNSKGTGPHYRQKKTGFPKNRWVRLKVHLYLSDGHDGRTQVWQDESLIIDARGGNLFSETSVYDRLQVGLTANPTPYPQVLYVDDVRLSHQPL